MTDTPSPGDVPLYETGASRDAAYSTAQAERQPYLAVEAHEGTFAVVYDLMPAGVQLTERAGERLVEAVTDRAEALVGDEATATVELSHSVGVALGSVAGVAEEATARDLAAAIADIVLDEDNWTDYQPADDVDFDAVRTN